MLHKNFTYITLMVAIQRHALTCMHAHIQIQRTRAEKTHTHTAEHYKRAIGIIVGIDRTHEAFM